MVSSYGSIIRRHTTYVYIYLFIYITVHISHLSSISRVVERRARPAPVSEDNRGALVVLELYLHRLMTVQRTVGTATESEREPGDREARPVEPPVIKHPYFFVLSHGG